MAFKVKQKKPDYAKLELEHFTKEHKHPKFLEVTREGTRQATFVPEISHRKGVLVYYKNRLHIVKKSSPDGVLLYPLSRKKEVFADDEVLKPVFVKEKDYEQEVEPVFISTPFYLSPTIAGEYPER